MAAGGGSAAEAYLGVGAIMGVAMWAGCANRIVLMPTTRPQDARGAQRRAIPFRGGTLCVFVARSPGCAAAEPAAFDLELMGNGSRAEGVAAPVALRWGDRPVEVWALNYPGYGQSSGPATLEAIGPSALAAYDALAAVAGDRPILVGGHSLGTAAALYVARQRNVAGLLLLNPPPLRQLIVRRYGWWNLWLGALPVSLQIPPQLDSLANAARCRAPAVFVSSTRDTLVPPRFHRMVFAAYAGPKRLVAVAGAGHNDFPNPATLNDYKVGLDWLWPRTVPPAGVSNKTAIPAPHLQIK